MAKNPHIHAEPVVQTIVCAVILRKKYGGKSLGLAVGFVFLYNMWLAKRIKRTVDRILKPKGEIINFYFKPSWKSVLDEIRKIKSETEMLLSDLEAIQIYDLVQKTEKLGENIAEVGTYKGGSAKLICKARKERHVYLFDTFEGLPEFTENDTKTFGKMIASYENVKNYFRNESNFSLYKGLFPKSAESIKNKMFSFVHLDCDLYQSTFDSLEFFYPKMTKGGIILSHDYASSKGVKLAFDLFFQNKPEVIIRVTQNQCLVIKV